MSDKKWSRRLWSVLLAALLVLPGGVLAQTDEKAPSKTFSQEQLEQLLAPVALYPDDLLTQLLMASTYPLEVVKANNWVKQNKELKGDALTKALEKQTWDPSVKSLVNFPQVLQMMSDKVDWTQKLGDAFLAQQKDVLNTVQKLRKKALEAGNLKSTKEQKVAVDNTTQIIIIEPASPQVVYVPTYDPVVVYGVWAYPAYPPYYVYPAPYAGAAFFTGVAVGVAWGYAWGHCNWHGGDVNIDIDRNTNINRNIDRGKYAQQQPGRGGPSGSGKWQHDPSHRQGVSYRDSATAKQYGQGGGRQTPSTSEARGYGDRGGSGPQAGSMDRGATGGGPQAGSMGRGATGGAGQAGAASGAGRDNAFSGAGSGSQDRAASNRGNASRGGGGGGGRGGGGGGGRGGGRR
jgi:Protein of unknown function (DUF3300)